MGQLNMDQSRLDVEWMNEPFEVTFTAKSRQKIDRKKEGIKAYHGIKRAVWENPSKHEIDQGNLAKQNSRYKKKYVGSGLQNPVRNPFMYFFILCMIISR